MEKKYYSMRIEQGVNIDYCKTDINIDYCKTDINIDYCKTDRPKIFFTREEIYSSKLLQQIFVKRETYKICFPEDLIMYRGIYNSAVDLKESKREDEGCERKNSFTYDHIAYKKNRNAICKKAFYEKTNEYLSGIFNNPVYKGDFQNYIYLKPLWDLVSWLNLGEYFSQYSIWQSICRGNWYLSLESITPNTKTELKYIEDILKKYVFDIDKMVKMAIEEEPYFYRLINVDQHLYIDFFEDQWGNPNIKTYEGDDNYHGLEQINEFEKYLFQKCMFDRDDKRYRAYMIEDDKMRLAMELPARQEPITNDEFMENVIAANSGKLVAAITRIKNYLEVDKENAYAPKNLMFLSAMLSRNANKYKYLFDEDSQEDNYYYDLIIMNYLGHNYAIPVPVLADILKLEPEEIFQIFPYKTNRTEEEDVKFI